MVAANLGKSIARGTLDVALATTHHDPQGRLYEHIRAALPRVRAVFDSLAVIHTSATHRPSLDLLAAAGVHIMQQPPGSEGVEKLGAARRAVIARAFQTGAPFVMYCDLDRALHWAAFYADELGKVVARIPEHDFTVVGRTPRAFASHPRLQRDTERVVNDVYAAISGNRWDMTAAARGLSRRAADVLFEGCTEDTIGVDVAWPLHIQQRTQLPLGYLEADGLEFETADRYKGDVAAAGGLARWLEQLDRDPRRWVRRLELARMELEAMVPYADEKDEALRSERG
jgi:hypothetical protein